MEDKVYDLIVVGGGPAGLACAISARDNGLQNVLVLERDSRAGGILLQCIHNGFGLHHFGEELTGPEYAMRFVEEAAQKKVETKVSTMVLEIIPGNKNDIMPVHQVVAINSEDGLMCLKTKTVALAMGCRERTRGALVIPGTRPAGIFTAGSAQRFVNIDGYLPGKKVVILGSGDIGLIMARRLTLEGAEVKLVCEVMPYSAGLARNMTQCLYNFNIPLKLSTTIIQIHGTDRVTGVTIAQVDSRRRPIAGTEEYIECDTVLLSVGLIPENEISIAAGVNMDSITSGPTVNQFMETSVNGIFACGNSVHVHDLVDYVTEESLLAGKCAAEYIERNSKVESPSGAELLAVRPGNRVRYTVPQQVEVDYDVKEDSKMMLMFRSTDVYKGVTIAVYCGRELIFKSRKSVVRPGEMQTVNLKKQAIEKINSIKQPVTINIELPEDSID